MEQVIAEALAGDPAPAPAAVVAPPPGGRPDALTPRERDIAGLVARGLTNRQIAAELAISERTVSTHLTHILGKLGFATRAQAAAWATEQGLAPPARRA